MQSSKKPFSIMALGQKKQTISLQQQEAAKSKADQVRKDGTPTPVSINTKNTFNLHMIREKTLALSPLSPHMVNQDSKDKGIVSQDISQALFVA